MRRSNLLMGMVVLPSANALSLANFQQITSSVIPVTCMVAYNAQIPVCTTNDFNVACTAACQTALLLTGTTVRAGCLQVSAGSTTLLGIVMNGGIIQALCPKVTENTPVAPPKPPPAPTSIPLLSTRPVPPASSSTSKSVIPTLPIANPLLDPTTKQIIPQRTSTANPPPPATPTAAPPPPPPPVVVPPVDTQPSAVPTPSRNPNPPQIPATNTLRPSVSSPTAAPTPPTGGTGGTVDTSTPPQGTPVQPPPGQTTAPGARSTESPAASGNRGSQDTGGGSPFDSQRSQGNSLDGSSALCALVVAVWAIVLFGR
ncbi:hypothetical protein HYFRA_00003794 [Hymenoscyphus fraxineus]|uniref:Uncharacterized protein n=1 Tax=Hymenoscyphus fraxineus TaxID=746836 RepID=A0A9N9KYN1_9HELO|nr:hypothetical protein HYFRA_00003794 [Hymenoscyphus fraxineus]